MPYQVYASQRALLTLLRADIQNTFKKVQITRWNKCWRNQILYIIANSFNANWLWSFWSWCLLKWNGWLPIGNILTSIRGKEILFNKSTWLKAPKIFTLYIKLQLLENAHTHAITQENGADHLKTIAANQLTRELASFAPVGWNSSSIVHKNFSFCRAQNAFARVISSHRFAQTGSKPPQLRSRRKAANFLKREMSRLWFLLRAKYDTERLLYWVNRRRRTHCCAHRCEHNHGSAAAAAAAETLYGSYWP